MNFTKEFLEMKRVTQLMDLAEEQVAKRYIIEVKKILAKYKKYNLEFIAGNGTWYFNGDSENTSYDWSNEDKLPKDAKIVFDFIYEHDYILKYVSHITLGESNES